MLKKFNSYFHVSLIVFLFAVAFFSSGSVLNAQENVNPKDAKTVVDKQKQEIAELRDMIENLTTSNESKPLWQRISAALLFILIAFGLCLLINQIAHRIDKSLTPKEFVVEDERALRLKTLSKLFQWLAHVFVILFLIYVLLKEFGIDPAPLLAGAGIVGLAFGFGGQYLIRDIINGIFILLENQYGINDVIKVGEYGGLVEDINLRRTRLRDLEGRVIYIPNGEIKSVINFTSEFAQALMNIGVAYKENVDEVMDVLKELAAEMREDEEFGQLILEDLEMLGVDDFGNSAVVIKCRLKTLPIKQWTVAREFRRRIKNKFDELGIEIPFPHQTIYWGKDQNPNPSVAVKN